MKVTNVTIKREDISKTNIAEKQYPYGSVVNNNTSETSGTIIQSAAAVLFDIYSSSKEKPENETEENN